MFDDIEKMRLTNKYWSIIRSMMPEKVMHLMMKDYIDYQDDPKIQRHKPLIEKAKFFENLSFYGLSANQEFWLIWASSKFDTKVFGENHGFYRIKPSLPYQLIAQTNIKDLESFLFKILQQAGYQQTQLENEHKKIQVDLNQGIILNFDYSKNAKNPEVDYLNVILSEIELHDTAIELGFSQDQHYQTQLKIIISLTRQDDKILIKNINKV